MFDRLSVLEDRYMQLNEMLADPEVLSDSTKLRQYSKEQAQLEETVQMYRQYKETSQAFKEAKAMLEDRTLDADMRELAKEEMNLLEPEVKELEAKLRILLLPKTRTMTRTSSSKSEGRQAETKPPSLQEIYIRCIR